MKQKNVNEEMSSVTKRHQDQEEMIVRWLVGILLYDDNKNVQKCPSKANNQPACDEDGQQDARRDTMKQK